MPTLCQANLAQMLNLSNAELFTQTHLDLSSMNIVQVDTCTFNQFTQLIYLNLSHNLLTYLNSSLLRDVTNLLALDVSYNQLADINGDIFTGLVNIELLALGHNPFSNLIPWYILNLFNLTYLDMSACNLTVSNFNALITIFQSHANDFIEMTQFHLEDNLFTSSDATQTLLQLLFTSILNKNLLTIYLRGNPIYNGSANIQSLCGFNKNCVIVPDSQ